MSENYAVIIVLTTIAFAALAAILLVPVYRFLKKEDQVNASWTEKALADRGVEIERGVGEHDLGTQQTGAEKERLAGLAD